MTMPLWFLIASLVLAAGGTAAGIYNQRSMLNDQQDFNSAEAEKARDWSSEGSRYDRMTSLGFNPDLAAASIMGNAQSVPYAASSPQAPNSPANLLSSVQQMLGQMPMDMMNYKKLPYEIEGLSLDNDIKSIQAGYLPITLQQQVDYMDAFIENTRRDGTIKDFEIEFLKARAPYAKPLAAAEYFNAVGQVNKVFNEADKIFAETQATYADIDLKGVIKKWYKKDIQLKDSEIRVNDSATTLNYSKAFESETAANLNIANQGLVQAQAASEEVRAMSLWEDTLDKFIDNIIETGGQYIDKDTYKDLIVKDLIGEDGEGKHLAETFLRAQRSIYDNHIQSQWQNYSKTFWMNLGDTSLDILRGLVPLRRPVASRGLSNKGANTSVKGKPNSNVTSGSKRPTKVEYSVGSPKNASRGFPMSNGSYYWE